MTNDRSGDGRAMAMFAHLGALFMPILAPLLVLLLDRDSDDITRAHAKEALNFQISMTILSAIAVAASMAFGVVTFGLGLFIIVPVVFLFGLALLYWVIRATMMANEGGFYRYPLTLRLFGGGEPRKLTPEPERVVIHEVEYQTPPPEAQTIPPMGAAAIARLVRVRRGQPVQEYEVTVTPLGSKLIIGRDRRQTQITVSDDPTVSRTHAALLVDKNRVYIEDLASQWGTEVNGQRLLMRQLLHHNDRIRMGDSEFVFVQAQAQ